MLAAVGGVLYTLATVLKLQGYSAYVQPMPVVVAAMRWGPAAGRKTMTATCFLLLGEPDEALPLPQQTEHPSMPSKVCTSGS